MLYMCACISTSHREENGTKNIKNILVLSLTKILGINR